MRRADEQKRSDIIRVGTKLFAMRRFHEVRLGDVATEARIGKGTIYVYFKSKEDLYHSVIHDAMKRLVDRLKEDVSGSPCSAWDRLRMVVKG